MLGCQITQSCQDTSCSVQSKASRDIETWAILSFSNSHFPSKNYQRWWRLHMVLSHKMRVPKWTVRHQFQHKTYPWLLWCKNSSKRAAVLIQVWTISVYISFQSREVVHSSTMKSSSESSLINSWKILHPTWRTRMRKKRRHQMWPISTEKLWGTQALNSTERYGAIENDAANFHFEDVDFKL